MTRQVASAASGVLRDSHYVLNSVTGLYERSTLLELARTNLCLQSQTLQTTWTGVNATLGQDADTAPDGTATGDRVIEDATAATSHLRRQASITITANADVALSVYAKAGTRTQVRIRLVDSTFADGYSAVFNLSTGVTGATVLNGAGTLTSKTIEALGNGWYRCIVVGKLNGGRTSAVVDLMLCDAGGASSYNGDGASFATFWGAQVENNVSFATAYIVTTTTSATRNADALSYALPTEIATPRELTMYAKFVERGTILMASETRVLVISSGTSPTVATLRLDVDTNKYRIRHVPAAGGVQAQAAAAPSYGDTVELRGVLASTGAVQIGQSINGAAEVTTALSGVSALDAAWSASTLHFNGMGGNNCGAIAFLAVKMALGTKTLAEMRDMAAMDTVVLVLDAGASDAVTVACQSAQQAEAEDIGGRARAFAGNLRVSTRDQKRAWRATTSLLTQAERDAVETKVADNQIIPCAGILFGNETVNCSVKVVDEVMVSGTGLFVLTLAIAEV